jgi:hypothetical protein
VEKTNAKLARQSGKPVYRRPAPPKTEFEKAKKHLCQAHNFLFFFALLGHPGSEASVCCQKQTFSHLRTVRIVA